MRRPALYSSSTAGRPGQKASPANPLHDVSEPDTPTPAKAAKRSKFSASSPYLLWTAILLLGALLALSLSLGMRPAQRKLTQEDINAAVLKTLETKTIPSEYAKAYEKIRPSVVRVVSFVRKSRLKDEAHSLPK